MRRVVITGLGPLTPIGSGNESFTEALMQGKSGIDKITRFDTSGYVSHHAGEIKNFDLQNFCPDIKPNRIKRLALFSQYGLAAAEMAIKDSGIIVGKNVNPDDIAVRLGTGVGGLNEVEFHHSILKEKGPNKITPLLVPMVIADAASSNISLRHNIKGEAISVTAACASGLNAACDSFDKIKLGHYSVIVAGGIEACITPLTVAAFSQSGAMSKKGISRPYDKERDGFVLSEGAGILILEDLEHALKRKAKIYCEILGYGASSDAYHEVAPDPTGNGIVLAIDKAMINSKCDYFDYINTHGTSTELSDKVETIAIQTAFGKLTKIPVSSTKSMVGHAMGAASGIELIATILAMERGFIPPTINYVNSDPDCTLDCVPNKARKQKISNALKISSGFGGHNYALAIKKYDGN